MSKETQKTRKPAVAGSFYPASAKEIKSMLGGWLHPSGNDALTPPRAIIVPHAGYVFSGEVAASAYNRIPPGHQYKRVFLLGPSHRAGFAGASVDTVYSFAETPLGKVPIDISLGKRLISEGKGAFTFWSEAAHDGEHCLEVQLPFLQMVFGDVPPIVPIVIGTERLSVIQNIAKALEPYFNEDNLFIISSDFSHYPSYEDARSSDLYLAETITTGGLEEFLKALRQIDKQDFPGQGTAACGACAIAVLLEMMDAQGRDSFSAEHVMYRNSGDSIYGDKDRVVGYNSIVFTSSDHLFHFTQEEKKKMIATARSSIYSYLGLKYDGNDSPVGVLKEKGYGVFVTLNLNGNLRGCIGRFTSPSSLHSTIREMARSAAFDDPRFPALSKKEAPEIEIEVSVLSPLKRIQSIDEFKLGRDGIYMIKGYNHGTFLPQVAKETGWNTEEFLGHCARDKAGIGYYGWKDAELYTYQTEVVKEYD
ncbi:MAG: AmmeMemoRadiSam system protein B [Bacteroidales bacterium]|nr:AmmeMemoRadiSam system protein B [Bacteroidales bacterium]